MVFSNSNVFNNSSNTSKITANVDINQLTNFNVFTGQNALIIGGGPAGMYAALRLLEAVSNCSVKVIEKRSVINRPQVINTPFDVMNALPDRIKQMLWPEASVRESIFGVRSRQDPEFWPYSEYKYLGLIQIGEFQRVIKRYIEEKFSDRFTYEVIEELEVECLRENINAYDIVLVATGNGAFTKSLRKFMKVSSMMIEDREEIDSHGVYLVYEATARETYERKGRLVSKSKFTANGITYAHSNDSANHVQVYTFPVGKLRDVFAQMPASFKETAGFSGSNQQLTFDGKKNGEKLLLDEQRWFDLYKRTMKEILYRLQVPVVPDEKIKVYYAQRSEYYYENAATTLMGVPVLFIGDASGCTDYKLGLSLGRGLFTVMHLTQIIKSKQSVAFEGIKEFHNEKWKNVVLTEFNKKNELLSKTPEMVFKYFMQGRIVDGCLVNKAEYVKEMNQMEILKIKSKNTVTLGKTLAESIRI